MFCKRNTSRRPLQLRCAMDQLFGFLALELFFVTSSSSSVRPTTMATPTQHGAASQLGWFTGVCVICTHQCLRAQSLVGKKTAVLSGGFSKSNGLTDTDCCHDAFAVHLPFGPKGNELGGPQKLIIMRTKNVAVCVFILREKNGQ